MEVFESGLSRGPDWGSWMRAALTGNPSCKCQKAASRGSKLYHWVYFKASSAPLLSPLYPLCLNRSPTPAIHLANVLTSLFFAFLLPSHSNALLLLLSVSSTLLSVFPSPYINSSKGEVSQASDKKNIPLNKDLWNGNLPIPASGCVCEFIDEGISTQGIFWPLVYAHCSSLLLHTEHNTHWAGEWWWFSLNCTLKWDCNLPCLKCAKESKSWVWRRVFKVRGCSSSPAMKVSGKHSTFIEASVQERHLTAIFTGIFC